MPSSAAERTLKAKLAAHTRWSGEDPKGHVAKMRSAFDKRFVDQVDPDRTLSAAERERRVACARKAYFARLALKSAQARRARAS